MGSGRQSRKLKRTACNAEQDKSLKMQARKKLAGAGKWSKSGFRSPIYRSISVEAVGRGRKGSQVVVGSSSSLKDVVSFRYMKMLERNAKSCKTATATSMSFPFLEGNSRFLFFCCWMLLIYRIGGSCVLQCLYPSLCFLVFLLVSRGGERGRKGQDLGCLLNRTARLLFRISS